MFGIGFVFVFGISVSICFFSRADARSRRKQVSKQKWFLGHVLDCMQRRSNGSCLVIALLVAARILVADSIMPTDFIKNFRGEMIPRKLILERSAEFSVHIQKLDEELR